ncbi:sphingomyelin phosphodiesterase acid-like 3 [Pelomyxa schiedti]|nr:sphingomyelin phosphodiesterase acid-like 3 [Pelomyxa schiedti]
MAGSRSVACRCWVVVAVVLLLSVLYGGTREIGSGGRFLHLADVHFSPYYAPGSDVDLYHCVNASSVGSAGRFGDYACDVPYVTYKSAWEFAKSLDEEPDFIIWSGDIVPHYWSEMSEDIIIQYLKNATDMIKQLFPDTQVFPLLGNHDSYPEDVVSPNSTWLFEAAVNLWSQWLGPDQLETLSKGGYYTYLMHQDLRFIFLNTLFYCSWNPSCIGIPDPADQFMWLQSTLEAAKKQLERVFIIAHVPPGYSERDWSFSMLEEFNDKYIEIFSAYSDIIVAHLYGHLHTDSFRVMWQTNGNNVPVLITGSVATVSHINPQIREYFYLRDSPYTLTDYTQYYLDLLDANQRELLEWKYEYTFTTEYNLPNLSGDSLALLIDTMHNNETVFQHYLWHNRGMADLSDCDEACKRNHMCTVTLLHTSALENCLDL